jgi:hypothetical protein
MALTVRTAIGFTIAACLWTVAAGARQTSQDESAVLADFARRVHAYDVLRCSVESPVAVSSFDPDGIIRAINACGDAIRGARSDACLGDVFTPEVAALFRRYIRESCDGDFQGLLAMTAEDVGPLAAARVNGRWPGEALPTMPPRLLAKLPVLPSGLQYRFVNRDLVLWDSQADLVIDIIPDAIPPLTVP